MVKAIHKNGPKVIPMSPTEEKQQFDTDIVQIHSFSLCILNHVFEIVALSYGMQHKRHYRLLAFSICC